MLPTADSDDLDTFVTQCDAVGLGTAACTHLFNNFHFDVDRSPVAQLDPFGVDYMNYQLDLYNLLSGRSLDQQTNELTNFDYITHLNGPNPYTNITPSDASRHMMRILKMLQAANLQNRGLVLDMGAGWGLSSEIAAYIGCNVIAVDINSQFVRLIQERAARSKLPIKAVQASFDGFECDDSFDLICFYECLHHAVKPWEVIARLAHMLKPTGKFALAHEPINDYWWKDWGLRLDPLSIYCIRKFGWFESGWSRAFITKCFERSGFVVQFYDDEAIKLDGPIVLSQRSKI